jgi:hypothetical protein
MPTEVIYARVPEDLKEAAEKHAAEHGVTLTAAIVDLLERGLTAAAADRSPEELLAEIATLNGQKAQLAADLRAAVGELATLRALADRTRTTVGTCNACTKPITGYDLLATSKCAHCGHALPDLLSLVSGPPSKRGVTPAGSFNERDLLLLLGAIGAVVGVAYLASKA